MVAIQDETEAQGVTLTQDEVVEKILKRRSCYVQGLGVYARPISSSRSTTTSRTFKTEARLRVTEMRGSFDSERVEMKKRLESLAATVRIDKIFQIFMEQSAYTANNTLLV